MKSYFIFTIVLTVAYLVYYAVIIVQDLYGKKGNGKPEEEVFDLGAPEDEQSVYVTESDTGFNVGNEKYETDVAPTASPAPQETETADNNGEIAVAENTGNDARLRGDDDAVRAVHLLRCRLGFRSRCRAPDLYQNEHRRGRRGEVYRITCRCVPLHHWSFNRVPCFLRLPHIGG